MSTSAFQNRLGVLLLLVLCARAGVGAVAQADTRPIVLVLHSYDPSVEWTRQVGEGLQQGLARAGWSVDLREEYLDARHDTRPEYQARLRELLSLKFDTQRPALIVTSDDHALEFLLSVPELFAGVPIVFGGVESRELVSAAPRDRVTGVVEEFRLDYILDTALRVRPSTRRVFVVSANTRGGDVIRSESERLRAAHPSLTFVPLSAAELTLPAITRRLADDTRDDDVVIAMPVVRDAGGLPIDGEVSVARIASASRAPVFGVAFSRTGQGVLAVTASTGVAHGAWMARKAVGVLGGMATRDIPIDVDPETLLAFDAEQMARWNVPDGLLPPGSQVRNRSASFYAMHPRLVLGVAGFFVVQSLIIGGLVLNVRRRRRAEQRHARQALALADANRDLEHANESLRREHDAHRQTEAHLRQAQKMEAVGRLAGGVAHDFNTLLTVIIGYCALLLDDTQTRLDRRDALQQIRKASEQAVTLTQNLLAFSRRQVSTPVVVDIVSTVRSLAGMLGRFCGDRVDVSLALDPATGRVSLGEGQLEQVLINLVINARDALPDGGRLTIVARPGALPIPDAPDDAPDLPAGAYAVLEVRDTGIGMDPDTRGRIFEPFFTTKPPGRGTGLGLATVYGIVTQHGGAITVDSAPGKGTTFAAWLPVTSRTPAPAPMTGQDEPPARKGTILVVDDEEDLRRLACLVLQQGGFQVLEARCGADARTIAAEHPGDIDLLLTDIVMPDEDGFAVARQVRAARPAVAVAYMSGYAEQAVAGMPADAEDGVLLRKPFTPEDLLAQVRSAVGRDRSAPES